MGIGLRQSKNSRIKMVPVAMAAKHDDLFFSVQIRNRPLIIIKKPVAMLPLQQKPAVANIRHSHPVPCPFNIIIFCIIVFCIIVVCH